MSRSIRQEAGTTVERLEVSVFEIPTETPEADGTQEWHATTLVVTELTCGGERGLGFTYGSGAAAGVISTSLAGCIVGANPMEIPALWNAMVRAVRNIGRPGVAATAIAAVDIALWDLKSHLLHLPLATLLGMARPSVPVYGSGGFTSYDEHRLKD